jgi:hypothetical protein
MCITRTTAMSRSPIGYPGAVCLTAAPSTSAQAALAIGGGMLLMIPGRGWRAGGTSMPGNEISNVRMTGHS